MISGLFPVKHSGVQFHNPMNYMGATVFFVIVPDNDFANVKKLAKNIEKVGQ